ncbi:MAG: hypothetical protein AB8F95_18345 [Bacteroidia bacterium]
MLKTRQLAPFAIAALVSGLAMWFLMEKSVESQYGLAPPLIIVGTSFIGAIRIRFKDVLATQRFLLTAFFLFSTWGIAFFFSYHALWQFIVPISGFGGSIATIRILAFRHKIRTKKPAWKLALLGMLAAIAGMATWWILDEVVGINFVTRVRMFTTEDYVKHVPCAFIVFFWQIAMGLIYMDSKVEKEALARIEEIGVG